ncbi:P-loop containing nucleoside triphosphate hydrolase protein [Colletotrichum navitas]|uniref:P-loop containing nucleoside triphosphate hydrolase protein n=1 Tax=Colletotrichum navitas TaxID=681940 RepID=A0AAD8PM64_9PEZI|nr:P-loop containing nucleoside triphosphate hydrolase protein [Colletotrichum navitas]KAK1569875.1 P-loop containing nucleoside triphosphate hydrolase protein [Colletotrichum navitas]
MWLRDALPYHLLWEHTNHPMARVITYGYESEVVNSRSMQNLEDLATTFRDSLNTLTSSRKVRPLIFVAHSLGGLIVKQALITVANSEADDHHKLLQAVYGVVSFGVPHDGMEIRSLVSMVGDGPNRELVGSLNQINSQILSIQQRDFHRALGAKGQTEVFCFYETQDSPTAKQDEDGTWSMSGERTVLVTKSSATHCRPWEDGPENICAINRSHQGMIKFGIEDHDYELVRGKLEGLAQRALTVQSRLRANKTNFLVPYNQNPDYIGRLETLDTIKDTLGYGKNQTTQYSRVSLFGLGGVGKTQVALAFSYWIRDNCSDVSVFWVHSASTDRFRQAFTSIAEECRIPGHDDSKSDVPMLVRRWLEKKERGRWIMIIDNADDKELFFPSETGRANTSKETSAQSSSRLSDYLPDCAHGSILITTRDKRAALRFSQGKPSIIEIEKMNQNETGQLLQRTLGKEAPLEEVSSLSARLEYLPLALVQAAAFIQENSISISEYLQLLDESDENLVDQLSEPFTTVGRDSGVPNEVTATWIVSFNQIQQRDTLASQILSFICLLDRQAIPKKIVTQYCNQSHEGPQPGIGEVTKALGTLKAFSFVAESKDNILDLHRLIQLVTRKWLVMRDEYTKYSEYSMDVVSTLFPYGKHETRQE